MRQIKFRGISTKTGKYVYGYYVPQCPMSTFPAIVDDDGFINEVELDSVAQLVGHDKDGKEVYEGDICIEDGKEFKAVFEPDFFKNVTLKEDNYGR